MKDFFSKKMLFAVNVLYRPALLVDSKYGILIVIQAYIRQAKNEHVDKYYTKVMLNTLE